MDWYIDDPGQSTELRHEFAEYLKRHAAPGQDIDGAVLSFSELVTNAFEHGGGSVWVSVDWTGPEAIITVQDLGPSFELATVGSPVDHEPRGRGLAIAAALAKELDVAVRDSGGSKIRARLDLQRMEQTSLDPPRRGVGVLPRMNESGPDGFGREPFLRALVVQLAQEAELISGPDAAEAMVAQVGTDVGSQMEEEFRRARDIVDKLTPEQMADCFVRLKHAIEGDFYPVEVSSERIVLANRTCPFGLEVQKAPALCRMTSSVFGGIAARNAGGATVLLEERIAVGDHQCRVVISLGETTGAHPSGMGHRYMAPVEP